MHKADYIILLGWWWSCFKQQGLSGVYQIFIQPKAYKLEFT
jgi:hypothetical protein